MKSLGIAVCATAIFFLGFVVMYFFEIVPWILVTMLVVGHGLIGWMVYSIFADKYSTKLEFKSWHQDCRIKNRA